jgi:hypothetical protein
MRQGGRNDIADDRNLPAKKPKNIILLWLDRDELRDRFAVLRDHNRLALGLNLVHDRKTIGLEGTRSHLPHLELLLNIVIMLFSYLVILEAPDSLFLRAGNDSRRPTPAVASHEELAMRTSIGHFLFSPPGVNANDSNRVADDEGQR